LNPPGPLLAHLHTVYMACSECLPTRLNPVAEGTCCSQVCKRGKHAGRASAWTQALRASSLCIGERLRSGSEPSSTEFRVFHLSGQPNSHLSRVAGWEAFAILQYIVLHPPPAAFWGSVMALLGGTLVRASAPTCCRSDKKISCNCSREAKIKSWAVCSAVALGLQILAICMVPYWGRRYVERIHRGTGLHAEATCMKRGSKDPNSDRC
jgi:hypothetical protein